MSQIQLTHSKYVIFWGKVVSWGKVRKTPLGVRGCLGEKCDLASDPRNFSDLSRMSTANISN